MKYIWFYLIWILYLSNASSYDITGEWSGDWQNTATDSCSPSWFRIDAIDANTFNITYLFSETIEILCSRYNATNGLSSTLVQNSTNTWTDGYGGELVYDSDIDIIMYPFALSQSLPMIYFRNQSLIPQDFAMNSIQAVWYNRSQVDPSANTSHCCVPDDLFIVTNGDDTDDINVNMNFSSNSNCTAPYSYFDLGDPNPLTLNWSTLGGFRRGIPYNSIIYFSPLSEINQIMYVQDDTDPSCNFYYQRYNQLGMISGQWIQDWQTSYNSYGRPRAYEITVNGNNSFMTSTITENGVNSSSVVLQTFGGYYYDPNFDNGFNFTIDTTTNTLTGRFDFYAAPYLFSPNGSLFSATPFKNYWGIPRSTDGSPLPDNCCIPTVINISNATYGLEDLGVTYFFTQDLSSNPACQDLSTDITHGSIVTSMSILTPNTSQLVWTDQNNNQIFFANRSTTTEITISNFYGQCSFNMVPIPAPKPPVPLSESLVSHSIIYFVFAFFMVFACI